MHSIDKKPALKNVLSSAEDDSDLLQSQSPLVREPEDDHWQGIVIWKGIRPSFSAIGLNRDTYSGQETGERVRMRQSTKNTEFASRTQEP